MIAIALLVLWLFVRRAVVRPMRDAMRFAERIAQGDLTAAIGARSRDEAGQLLDALARMSESLKDIVRRTREAADAVDGASGGVAAGTVELSRHAQEQASSLQETAAGMEELASTVQLNAESAHKADAAARDASANAQAGGAEVRKVVRTMGEISAASRQIGDIVSVIDSIAFQTNILALNAAVEAARAGEQGRGFAVVAAEVRSLAQRSAGAAKEIKGLVERSTAKVDAGAALVERAGATIDKLVASVQEVSALMSSIAEASAEQARGVGQVNRTVAEMERVVQQTARAVEQSSAAADGMRRQAQDMVLAVSTFRMQEAAPAAGAADALPDPEKPRAPLPAPEKERRTALAAGDDWEAF